MRFMRVRSLRELDEVRWESQVQPPWNLPDEVPRLLRELAALAPEPSNATYSRMLHALGNDHRGTYYPVALVAVPFLGGILREGSPDGKARALDVLLDLYGSFVPAPGFERVETASGPRSLEDLVMAAVVALREEVEHCQAAPDSPAEQKLARDLLGQLSESL